MNGTTLRQSDHLLRPELKMDVHNSDTVVSDRYQLTTDMTTLIRFFI